MFDVKTSDKYSNRFPDIGEVYEMYYEYSGYRFYWMCTHIDITNGKLVFSGYNDKDKEKHLLLHRFYPFGAEAGITIIYGDDNYESFTEDEFRKIHLRYMNKIDNEKLFDWFNHVNAFKYADSLYKDCEEFRKFRSHILPFFHEGGVYLSSSDEYIICMAAVDNQAAKTYMLRGFKMVKEGYSIKDVFVISKEGPNIHKWILKGDLSPAEFILYKNMFQNSVCPNISFILNHVSYTSNVIDYGHYRMKNQ